MPDKIALKTLDSQEWSTPQKLYDELDEEFKFNLDSCATKENAKCKKYFTEKENGLYHNWYGSVFCNPPFRYVSKWVEKAMDETVRGNAKTVVMLLPSRTDTKWFHNYCLRNGEIRFIKGRLKYGGAKNSAPFPSMIVIFRSGKNGTRSKRNSR